METKLSTAKTDQTGNWSESLLGALNFLVYVACLVESVNSDAVRSGIMVTVLKFRKLLLLSVNKMLVIRGELHKMYVRIANRDYPDQTASSDAV